MPVTPEIVQEFKDRMHFDGDHEDGNLERILSASEKELLRVCGSYDIATDEPFKELVFERSRYVYNDALEYFNTNFLSQINSLSVDKALEAIVLEDTTTTDTTTTDTTTTDTTTTDTTTDTTTTDTTTTTAGDPNATL